MGIEFLPFTNASQKIEQVFHSQLGLPENTLQNRLRKIEPIVPWNSHSQMRLLRMT